jgi:hypothetical protein
LRLHIVFALLIVVGFSGLRLSAGTAEATPNLQPSTVPNHSHNPLWMSVEMEPTRPQKNAPFVMRVRVFNAEGAPVSDASVHATITMSTAVRGRQELDFNNAGGGLYQAQTKVGAPGAWEVWLTAARGSDRVRQFTPFQIRE